MSKNHKKTGEIAKKTGEKRAIFPKRPFKTGMPVLKRATSEHCFTGKKKNDLTNNLFKMAHFNQ